MSWLSNPRRGLLQRLLPLILVVSQLTLISHEIQADHGPEADCEFCLVLKRTDDALNDADLTPPPLTTAVFATPKQVHLAWSGQVIAPVSRGPPTH